MGRGRMLWSFIASASSWIGQCEPLVLRYSSWQNILTSHAQALPLSIGQACWRCRTDHFSASTQFWRKAKETEHHRWATVEHRTKRKVWGWKQLLSMPGTISFLTYLFLSLFFLFPRWYLPRSVHINACMKYTTSPGSTALTLCTESLTSS